MRDYQVKSNEGALPDSNSATKYGGGEVTSLRTEAKNAVSRAGLALAPQSGAGEDTTQLAQALFINGVAASAFQDGGAADAIALTPVTGSSGLLLPPDYTTLDGAEVSFFAAAANLTTTPTASIGQTGGTQFGAKTIVREDGSVLGIGDINTSVMTTLKRNDATDKWLLIRGAGAGDTNLPIGFIQGLILSNGLDPDADIDITPGKCRDSTDTVDIVISSALGKTVNSGWVAGGTPAAPLGGLRTGSFNADTWYHVFVLLVGGSGDAGFDTDVNASSLISTSGATAFRRIGSVLTDSTSDVIAFIQDGDWFEWVSPAPDQDGAGNTTGVLLTLSTPPDVITKAQLSVFVNNATTETFYWARSPSQTNDAPVANNIDLYSNTNAQTAQVVKDILTNTSSQIRYRSSLVSNQFDINTNGYTDSRGRNG